MNYQNDPKINRRLEQLEAEVNPNTPINPTPSDLNSSLKTLYGQLMAHFKRLPKAGQIVIVSVGVIAGLALLKTLVELISLAISLAVVGAIVYIGYQVFKSSQKPKI